VIRLAAFDLDGTLMDDDMIISARVRQAIAAAQERGVVVTLATGRMFDFLLPIAQDLGITAPLICYQGGLIQAPGSDGPLYRATLEPALVREVLEWQAQRGARVFLYAGEDVFLTERQHPDEFYRYMLGERLVWVDDLAPVLDRHEPIKFIVILEPYEVDQVRAELQQRFGERMRVTRSHEIVIEGNPPGVSKGEALRRLAYYLQVPQTQVLAIGDHDNDVPMLTWAGVGVAMGNGSPAAKAVADWVAPSLVEDGAAVTLERFVLDTGGR
jgi:Cof subfamily protein (haloacid dehalogenase superfamily)